MPRLSDAERIQRAEQQIAKAQETITRSTKNLRIADRKKDTRRKIILGAAIMNAAARNENLAKYLQNVVNKLERPTDIAAFQNFEMPKPKSD